MCEEGLQTMVAYYMRFPPLSSPMHLLSLAACNLMDLPLSAGIAFDSK